MIFYGKKLSSSSHNLLNFIYLNKKDISEKEKAVYLFWPFWSLVFF